MGGETPVNSRSSILARNRRDKRYVGRFCGFLLFQEKGLQADVNDPFWSGLPDAIRSAIVVIVRVSKGS